MLELTNTLADVVAFTPLFEEGNYVVRDLCRLGCNGCHFVPVVTRQLFSNLLINLLAGREKFSYKEASRNLARHSHQLAGIARMELPRQTRG